MPHLNLKVSQSNFYRCLSFKTDLNHTIQFKSVNFLNWKALDNSSQLNDLIISRTNKLKVEIDSTGSLYKELLLVKILPDYFKLNQIETLFPTNWSILNNELIYNNSNNELIKSIDFNSNNSICGLRLEEIIFSNKEEFFLKNILIFGYELNGALNQLLEINQSNYKIDYKRIVFNKRPNESFKFTIEIKKLESSNNFVVKFKDLSLISCDFIQEINLAKWTFYNSTFAINITSSNLVISELTCFESNFSIVHKPNGLFKIQNSLFFKNINTKIELLNSNNFQTVNQINIENNYHIANKVIGSNSFLSQLETLSKNSIQIKNNRFLGNIFIVDKLSPFHPFEFKTRNDQIEISDNLIFFNQLRTSQLNLNRINNYNYNYVYYSYDFNYYNYFNQLRSDYNYFNQFSSLFLFENILNNNFSKSNVSIFNNLISLNNLSTLTLKNTNLNMANNLISNKQDSFEINLLSSSETAEFNIDNNYWGLNELNKNLTLLNLNKIKSEQLNYKINQILNVVPHLYGLRSLLCNDEWFEFKDKCYFSVYASSSLQLAKEVCSYLNGALSLESIELKEFIKERFTEINNPFWLNSGLISYDSFSRNFTVLNSDSSDSNAYFICEKEPALKCNSLCRLPNGVCKYPKCVCKNGWKGDNCDEFYCVNDCSGHGLCIGPNECKCNSGWEGKY